MQIRICEWSRVIFVSSANFNFTGQLNQSAASVLQMFSVCILLGALRQAQNVSNWDNLFQHSNLRSKIKMCRQSYVQYFEIPPQPTFIHQKLMLAFSSQFDNSRI